MVKEVKEVIVVEGKNDYHAVKRAFPDAEIIITSGFGLNEQIYNRIKIAQKKKGVIIFTDPDHMGEIIRKKIQEKVPGVKHCYISKNSATADGDIGIENASPEVIKEVLGKVRTAPSAENITYTLEDLTINKLVGHSSSQARREELGAILGIGYSNAKTFLRRLNSFGIDRKEFEEALKKMGVTNDG